MADRLLVPGCPAIFDALTPGFQRQFPRETWPPFCASVARDGALVSLDAQPARGRMQAYVLKQERAASELLIAVDGERIAALSVKPLRAGATEPVAVSR